MNTSGKRRAMTGSIHRIREFELEKVNLVEEFDILQIVGEGWFGKILLVEHRATDTEMVLKALPKPYVSIRDFYREFHYGLHLSAHKNIVTTYDVAFETAGFYVFSQEYAPLGDLTSNLLDTGIGELHTKRVAKQLGSALEHIHVRELVHRDVKLDNILIYKSDFSRIKLCDFGETRKINSVVRRRNEWLPYSPPEVLRTPVDNSYKAQIIHDIWQFGIVIFICLTGCLPWQKAAMDDPRYYSYYNWYNSSNPLKRPPKLFKMVSSKAQKMFKRFMEPRPEKRATNLIDFLKFMDDRWMAKGYTDRIPGGDIDELCPSMYSFHSDVNEKNKLLKYFLDHGIETTVDRQAKKQRIRDWIESSVITEEAEEEDENVSITQSCSQTSISDLDHAIECEKNTRNHPIEARYQKTSLRFADEKHINPRTGEVVEGVKTNHDSMLSYDVQNLEPVVGVNFAKRSSNRDESVSQSSAKDSAYGSLDFRGSAPTGISQGTSRNGVTDTAYNQMHVMSDTSHPSNTSTSVPLLMSGSPSRSLSSSSIYQNRSPMLGNQQRFQNLNYNSGSFKGSPYHSRDTISSTTRLQGSTTTLTSTNANGSNQMISQIPSHVNVSNPRMTHMSSNLNDSNPRINQLSTNLSTSDPRISQISSNSNGSSPRSTQISSNVNDTKQRVILNGYRQEIKPSASYVSMKDTAYDLTTMKNEISRQDSDTKQTQSPMVAESPYTSMMNIFQGQMSINPYGSKLNLGQNTVNVSVTPFNR